MDLQKQPLKGVPGKRCSENMQKIYRKTPMPKCDVNKVAKQLLKFNTQIRLYHIFFIDGTTDNVAAENFIGIYIILL